MPEPPAQPVGGLRMALNVLQEPAAAFAELRERPSWLLPAILVADPTGEQIEQFNEQMESVSPQVFIISGFLGASLGLIIIWLLQAGYLTLVSALTGDGFRFGNWFCLATWTAIPSLFSIVGMAITILLNPSGQIGQMELDPLRKSPWRR